MDASNRSNRSASNLRSSAGGGPLDAVFSGGAPAGATPPPEPVPMKPTRVAPGVNNQASRSVGRYSGGMSIWSTVTPDA